ncbi:MAG: nucleotidyltransferase family protein [Sedimentisphaerales bacterium]|nr:nucleotidyltransferase family protein [Sedimentisphaerales bacterium]
MSRKTVLSKLRRNIRIIRRRFAVKGLSVFGSVARNQAGRKSDIDVLVEFKGKTTFDLFMDLKFYLEDLLGTNVDLVTDKAIRPEIRKAIEREKINVA